MTACDLEKSSSFEKQLKLQATYTFPFVVNMLVGSLESNVPFQQNTAIGLYQRRVVNVCYTLYISQVMAMAVRKV